ncbi:MAG TPA: cupredoxin domain-containing protein [Candidatus Norongarragalinales archaeon]|nr:cupredoxin domain-containing protein [Candidatus Norongarragalinales archaeon]
MNKLFVVLLLAGLLIVGCTQSSQTAPAATKAPEKTQTQGASAGANPAQGGGSVQEYSLTAKQYQFSPSTLTVKKGQPVKITIESTDVPHGFALPDFGVQKELNPGSKTVVEFTPDKTGEFTFFCSVFCGSGHGSMKGKLIVTD